MSNTENGIGPRQSPMEILSMGWGWAGNERGPDRRVRHGYDRQGKSDFLVVIIVDLFIDEEVESYGIQWTYCKIRQRLLVLQCGV